MFWRRGPESNRAGRICNPVHNRFATAPGLEKREAKSNRASLRIWSGIRDSNSRPIPWQGIALPTELIPRVPQNCSHRLTVKALIASGVAISEERNYTPKFALPARCCVFSSPPGAPRPTPAARTFERGSVARARLGMMAAQAGVAKSVYARDLKSLLLTEMRVQVPPPAPRTRLPHSTVIDRRALPCSSHEERDEDDDGDGHAQEPKKQ